jgi:RHS repeat-associated protein
VQELNSSNGVVANLLTGLRIDENFTRTDSSGNVSTFVTDALGSTVGLVGSAGSIATNYTYQPFGATTAGGAANGNSYEFTGRENDGAGLYFYRARYYSPTFQRFIGQDPSGFGGGDANHYAYTLNSPGNLIDPFGLDIVVIGGSPILSNPFGHTSIAITGQGVFSFGTGTPLGSSLASFLLNQATYRNSTALVIKTSPSQDAEAAASLRGQPQKMGPMLLDNCSTRSNEALDAARIPQSSIPMDTNSLFAGGSLPGSAELRAAEAGATAYNIPEGSTSIPPQLGQFEPVAR